MSEAALLHCPIRGSLRVRQRAADNLTFTEEKQRIDAIRYLLQRRYPQDNFGIETTLFKVGRDGRNSFRTDFAIYDEPFDNLRGRSLERRLESIRLLAEIKRDNATAEQAKATQVKAAMSMVPDTDSLGVYWDDIEQRFFYRKVDGRRIAVHEAPISKIPAWGDAVDSVKLTYRDLDPAKDLVRIFDDIEDAFHTYIVDKVDRYTIIQQLLLTKIHDENLHRVGKKLSQPLAFQDFTAEAVNDEVVVERLTAALQRAAAHYNQYLPANKQIGVDFLCPPEALRNASKILAPVNILGSKVQVIQGFYMKFAKSLYKWDLAQYFTPHEVIDFIVDIANPQAEEHVHDPACGSADFLISAFRRAGPTAHNCVWGADSSEQAVQISILNMVLNGDGKTSIKNEDSLKAFTPQSRRYSVTLCNPPFGTAIVERRFEVLRKFDMGHIWSKSEGELPVKEGQTRKSQQAGILFVELCVRLTEAGGRIAIIVPNGYLGNKGIEYVALREWLLCNAKIAAIMAFPRFTFKKSGADVSASVLLMEKRAAPLAASNMSKDYRFFVGNIESVGWRVGDKGAQPIYKRDETTGDLLLNDDNDPILDADFAKIADEFLRSGAADYFKWAREDRPPVTGSQTSSIPIKEVLSSPILILDPKRYSDKFRRLQAGIKKRPFIQLDNIIEPVKKKGIKIVASKIYKYVEIEKVGIGEYDYTSQRGWQLPGRARLSADAGDIFIPHIWSCAGKWFMAAGDCADVIVTSGCSRFKVRDGAEEFLPDLLIGLSSELFAVQIRSLSTGSDGLADISDEDIQSIVLPKLNENARAEAFQKIAPLLAGQDKFVKYAKKLITDTKGYPEPSLRRSHTSLV